jgi:hypothetical protein
MIMKYERKQINRPKFEVPITNKVCLDWIGLDEMLRVQTNYLYIFCLHIYNGCHYLRLKEEGAGDDGMEKEGNTV